MIRPSFFLFKRIGPLKKIRLLRLLVATSRGNLLAQRCPVPLGRAAKYFGAEAANIDASKNDKDALDSS